MLQEKELIIDRLHLFLVGLLMLVGTLLLCVVVSVTSKNISQGSSWSTSIDFLDSGSAGSSNAVVDTMTTVATSLDHAVQNVDGAASNTTHSVQNSVQNTSHHVGSSISHAGRTAGSTVTSITAHMMMATVRSVCRSIAFTFEMPGTMVTSVSNATMVSALVKPADNAAVPIIGVDTPVELATRPALPGSDTVAAAAAPKQPVPQWPIHGRITTLFGVPEPPYQPIHTGIDISDGKRRGTTPIRAFRPGKVVQVIHSRVKLGNEVVVDHGNGITSVYGHMNSTSVSEGQQVDENTVLGYEGTTGVSTGVHLHFEVRINGVAHDPHEFIAGQPY
jgi:hypothetical protein